jgi:hypothetical protein
MWRDEKIKVDIPDKNDVILAKKVGNENLHSLQDYE